MADDHRRDRDQPALTPAEEEGIRLALESIAEGRGIPAGRVYEMILKRGSQMPAK